MLFLKQNFMIIAVLIILIATTYQGYRRGLVRTVFGLCSSIVILLVGALIYPVVSSGLRNNERVVNYVSKRVEVYLLNAEENKGEEITKEEAKNEINDKLSGLSIIGNEKRLDNMISEIFKSDIAKKTKKDVNKKMSKYISGLIINYASYILVYLALSLIFYTASTVLNLVSRLPVLKEINRLAGGFFGLVKGLIVVWIFFIVIIFIADKPFARECMRQINDNIILLSLYKYNIISRLIGF